MKGLVIILDRKVRPAFYHGRTIITLPQIDDFHNRPQGTAKRNFRINRKYFIEGEDFFEATYEEWTQLFGGTNFVPPKAIGSDNLSPPKSEKGGHRGSMILLTLTGYMMLVKSLNDDKAWQIHRALVNAYFAKKQANRPASSVELEAINADILALGTKRAAHKYGRSETFIKDHTREQRATKAEQLSFNL